MLATAPEGVKKVATCSSQNASGTAQSFRPMNTNEELSYSDIEIRSYLPTGWSLPTEEEGDRWNAKRRSWTVTLIDGTDLEWRLEVSLAEVETRGRMEALRRATRKAVLRG